MRVDKKLGVSPIVVSQFCQHKQVSAYLQQADSSGSRRDLLLRGGGEPTW